MESSLRGARLELGMEPPFASKRIMMKMFVYGSVAGWMALLSEIEQLPHRHFQPLGHLFQNLKAGRVGSALDQAEEIDTSERLFQEWIIFACALALRAVGSPMNSSGTEMPNALATLTSVRTDGFRRPNSKSAK
jgi:hypothetical protein